MLSEKTFHVEVRMAQAQREGQQARKEAETRSEGNRQNSAATGTSGRDSEPAQRQTERLAEIGPERIGRRPKPRQPSRAGPYARARRLPVVHRRSPLHGRAMPRK